MRRRPASGATLVIRFANGGNGCARHEPGIQRRYCRLGFSPLRAHGRPGIPSVKGGPCRGQEYAFAGSRFPLTAACLRSVLDLMSRALRFGKTTATEDHSDSTDNDQYAESMRIFASFGRSFLSTCRAESQNVWAAGSRKCGGMCSMNGSQGRSFRRTRFAGARQRPASVPG